MGKGYEIVGRKIEEVQSLVYNKRLDLQMLDRLVHSDTFESIWSKLKDDEQEAFLAFVRTDDGQGAKDFLKQLKQRFPETMSVEELRELAKKLGVRRYYDLRQAQLIAAIRRKRRG